MTRRRRTAGAACSGIFAATSPTFRATDLTEAALAHSLGSVEGAYRRMTALEKRRPEAYAGWLNGESARVIAFPTSKKAQP